MSTSRREAWLKIYNDYYDWKELDGRDNSYRGRGELPDLLSPLERELAEARTNFRFGQVKSQADFYELFRNWQFQVPSPEALHDDYPVYRALIDNVLYNKPMYDYYRSFLGEEALAARGIGETKISAFDKHKDAKLRETDWQLHC